MSSQQVNLWVTTPDAKIMQFTLEANEPIEHLKALLEVEVKKTLEPPTTMC